MEITNKVESSQFHLYLGQRQLPCDCAAGVVEGACPRDIDSSGLLALFSSTQSYRLERVIGLGYALSGNLIWRWKEAWMGSLRQNFPQKQPISARPAHCPCSLFHTCPVKGSSRPYNDLRAPSAHPIPSHQKQPHLVPPLASWVPSPGVDSLDRVPRGR